MHKKVENDTGDSVSKWIGQSINNTTSRGHMDYAAPDYERAKKFNIKADNNFI